MQMDHYLSTLHDFEIGMDFMMYIKRQAAMTKEPEDFVFEAFNPMEGYAIVYMYMYKQQKVLFHITSNILQNCGSTFESAFRDATYSFIKLK